MSKTPNFAAVTYETLKCENNGAIATITLNRPEKRNAISSTMIEELLAALNAALDVVRIPLGTADVMIAADLAVGAGLGVLERNAATAAVIGNLDLAATAAFKHDANLLIDAVLHRRTIERATNAGASTYLHAVRLAEQSNRVALYKALGGGWREQSQ